MSFDEFARRFEQRCLYASFIAKDDNEKIGHFIRGLNPVNRRDDVHLASISIFRSTVDKALGTEQDEIEIRQWRPLQNASSRLWKLNTTPTKENMWAK